VLIELSAGPDVHAGRLEHVLTCVALQAKPAMVKSTVVDNDTGKSIDSTVRTSTGTFFGREVRALLKYSRGRPSWISMCGCNPPFSLVTAGHFEGSMWLY